MHAILALILAVPALQDPQVVSATKEWSETATSELVRFYYKLHSTPELSFYEVETAAKMARVLRSNDCEVTEEVGRTGVVGVMRNGEGPTVLIRTDMDALPIVEKTGLKYASTVKVKNDDGTEVGVMHACGHDIHMTVWIGAVNFMNKHRDLWSGTAVFIAQPAEERGAGALAMLNDGLFERFPKPDYTFALHVDGYYPAGSIAYTPGYCYANVDSVDIIVRGRGGHGSRPHTAHDPVALAGRIIVGLQTIVSREVKPLDPAVVTVGSVHGGTKHNIIPEEVKLQLTVRTYTDDVRAQVLAAIERVALGEARAAGFPEHLMPVVDVLEHEHTPAAYNDPELVARINKVFEKAVGAENLMTKEPSMGGEDFGRYARAAGVPGYMFALGTAPPDKWKAAQQPGAERLPGTHNDDYAPLPEPTIRTGVTAVSLALLSLMPAQG